MGKELYTNIPSKVDDLLKDVKNGRTGLPDLQRPFEWKDAKIRDLLDSMMKGYPIGYIMLWESPVAYDKTHQIGLDEKLYKEPDQLVIDGQQRLTALLAAIEGVKVKDKNYKERNVRISFNPQTREFAVWSKGYENNPEWISEITSVFKAHEVEQNLPGFRRAYIKGVNESRSKKGEEVLTEAEEITIENNLSDLLNLKLYLLPTLKISADASEEDASDIFVRVNSGGQKLTEKNFIETLLAVYDPDVHDQINKFCEESRIPATGTSYNQIIEVSPSYLIRVAVGLSFKRARLRYAYMLLRGKDLETGVVSEETRKENLEKFRQALDIATNLNNWHAFLNLMMEAGYVSKALIASSNAVVFSYMLYLIGKYEYNVPPMELRKIMKKWVFMSTVTYFYTGSTESEVEKQFADLKLVKGADGFVKYLDDVIMSRFTEDYFNVTLIGDLNSSSSIAPSWYAYIASLNVLNTPMLFSNVPVSKYLGLGVSGEKNAIDRHHIFPKAYLEKNGIADDRDRNQNANFTYLDYNTNIDIGEEPPKDYVPKYMAKLGDEGYKLTCEQNALPLGFENMEYKEFLEQRRALMAKIIKQAFDELCK